MTKLTAKQEKFCQAIADGMTQADAYRAAYSADKTSDKVVYVKASEMMADGKISVRVSELKSALEAKQLWTREESVKTLAGIAKDNDAKQADQINAVKALNTMHGFDAPKQFDMSIKQLPTIIDDLV
ncbi:hypothetical protein SXAG_00112 [Synechococcus phage S-CBS4]|nr:hypothetical protein SXAG_00112 [Synechococcus phage S-CBS4]